MKNLFLTILVITSLLFLPSCDSKKVKESHRTAKETSAQMQIYMLNLIDANIAAFKEKEISQSTFQKLTAATGKVTKGIKIYRKGLDEVEKIFKETGNVPAEKMSWLNKLFDDNVVDPFFDVLESVKLLSPEQSEKVKTIIASLRLAILTIQDAFNIAQTEVQSGNFRSV